MLARGWQEVPLESGAWEFCYADVVWIHEHITYTARSAQRRRRRTLQTQSALGLTKRFPYLRNAAGDAEAG